MTAIAGALVFVAAAVAGFRMLLLVLASNKRLNQPADFTQISQKLNKPDP